MLNYISVHTWNSYGTGFRTVVVFLFIVVGGGTVKGASEAGTLTPIAVPSTLGKRNAANRDISTTCTNENRPSTFMFTL
jgi:hypothetical protein